jgi:hypothetical protein
MQCPSRRSAILGTCICVLAASFVFAIAAPAATGASSSDGGATASAGGAPSTLPVCSSNVIANTKAWIDNYIKKRLETENIVLAWSGKPLVDNQVSVTAITRAALLPCRPEISLTDSARNPANVNLVRKILPEKKWDGMFRPDIVGKGQGNGPQPKAAVTYQTFLELVGRFPYLCGEKGVWKTVTDACQRELAGIFANAAQETGEKPPPPGLKDWQAILSYTREQNCYTINCSAYDGGAAEFGAPASAHFYGRGMKQLSYVYNYAAASGALTDNYETFVKDPDLVASNPYDILGTALWFWMSPQPPKPSMDSVIVGTYKPNVSAAGIEIDPQSEDSVKDKFAATVSIINGAVECSATNSLAPDYLKAANNRFMNYKELLEYFGASLTKVEDDYSPRNGTNPDPTQCTIANGNPFADNVTELAYQPNYYLNTDPSSGAGTCTAIGYQSTIPLPIASDGMYEACEKIARAAKQR